jgi:hypothetical protein
VQLHPSAVGGSCTGALDTFNGVSRKFMQTADEVNANSVLDQRCSLSLNRFGKKGEEPSDLSVITPPVLPAEGVDGEVGDAELCSTRNDATEGFGTSGMSVKLIATLRTRPTAVAIHDDGNVAR